MPRSNYQGKPRHQPQDSWSHSPLRNNNKYGPDDDTQKPRWWCWWALAGGGAILAVLVLGVAHSYRPGPPPPSPPPEPPKPSPVPDPELVRICNHHHKIYNSQPYYTGNLDLFEVLALDARSAVFRPSNRNGRATAQDDARAEGVIQDAIMAQVERNLDGKRGRDGDGRAAAGLRRIIVDTGLLLQNATIRKLYIDGFVPVKEKSRNRGSENWLGAVCNNF